MFLNASLEANLLCGSTPRTPAPPSGHGLRPHLQGSALARFLELRGRKIVKACGAYWYAMPGRFPVPGHFLMSLPYQAMYSPDPEELRGMIREAGAFGARFPSSTWSGLESGLYIRRRSHYDVGSVHVKQRPRVRHGMRCFEVRPATRAQLLDQGWALNLSTMARQGRYDPEFGERRRWEAFIEASAVCPEISFPAAFAGGRLAAYMVTCREQNWLHILHQMSRQEDLSDFPNHVLTYEVTSQAAVDESLDAVCYGYVPLFSADGLHEYKLRFGYEVVPHRSAIQLHPILNAVVNRPYARAAVRMARRIRPGSQQLETLATVLEGARTSLP